MASGVIESNRAGGTVKPVHCGWAAHATLSAVELAKRAVTGPPSVLEGMFSAFLDGSYDPVAITGQLGERWKVPRIFFKPYPADHFTRAGIDAALALRADGVNLADIAELRLGVAEPMVRTTGQPNEVKRAPQTGYQAQCSGPYTVIAALTGGTASGSGSMTSPTPWPVTAPAALTCGG